MDKAERDTVFQVAGIVGLAVLLSFILWMQRQGDTRPPGVGAQAEASHEGGNDHASLALHGHQVHGQALQQSEAAVTPSGRFKDGMRRVTYEAFQYGFAPDPLVVRAGEKVRLRVKSRDVEHGMMIPEIDFNTSISPGEYKEVDVTAPAKPGKYPIFCSVFCGSGHGSMKGSLVVLPAEETHGAH